MSTHDPAAAIVRTGTASRTHYFSPGEWEGKQVTVEELLYSEQGPCLGHELEWMTHYEDYEEEVVARTLYCPHCCGVARV